ncbi:MAG: hypothetical protein GX621_06200 [Pirellulaceae bacterium]|nr:hypothetical protein [Pirellulaceae bacterium]
MNIWNKVLVGLIAVMLLPLFYFSAVALKTHQHWRSVANKIEERLPKLEQEIESLRFGGAGVEEGEHLNAVRVRLHEYLVNRGRIWRNAKFQGGEGGEYRVAVEVPNPHGITLNKTLYVFDQPREGERGCFLGEFKVNAVVEKDPLITLVPTMQWMSSAAQERLKSGTGLWTLCEVMPKDMLIAFEGMTEEEARALLPASVVDEYLASGKEGNERKLRDYFVLLKELDRQRAVLIEEHETAKRHEAFMRAATEDATKNQLKFRSDERADLMTEQDRVKAELDAALAHRQSLEEELAQVEAKIIQLIADNRATAEEMARIQAELVRQVDRRTEVVAH